MEDWTLIMVYRFSGVEMEWVKELTHSRGYRAVSMGAISARFLVALKAQRFAIGGYVTSAATNGGSVIRLPGSALALSMILKHKLFPTTFAPAASLVEYLAFGCFGESHNV